MVPEPNPLRHDCPGAAERPRAELAAALRRNHWLMTALEAVASSELPEAWIGAGAIRDVVWTDRYGVGGFDPAIVRDIDVAYLDPADLRAERDQEAQHTLSAMADLPWEATNQAAVHTWYHTSFGGPPVEPFNSVHDAVATWPETATCVAVRLAANRVEVCAPHGLADLLNGVWRMNPVRVTPEISAARLARQRVRSRWPGVRVVPPT